MEAGVSVLRVVEHVPCVGHVLALVYLCLGRRSMAERAAIKASLGIVLCFVNMPAELLDEARRKPSRKLYSSTLTPRPDWMKNYKRRPLRYLCLPASHQSATYRVQKHLRTAPMTDGWAQCQKFDIWAQLVAGIRFLDLRLMSDKSSKEVWTHHNVIQCTRFRDVLQAVRDFTKEYPTEVVSLFLSSDGRDLDWGQVRAYITEYIGAAKIIPEHMSEMAIGDMTNYGRNVIFHGVPDVSFSWSCLDYRWPNKNNPEDLKTDLQTALRDLTAYNPYYLFWYKAECATNAAMIVRDIGGVPGYVAAKKSPEKFAFLEDLAAAVNYNSAVILQDIDSLPLNVFSTDFVCDEIISRIIQLNSMERTGAGQMSRTGSMRSQSRLNSFGSSISGSLNRDPSLNRSFALATNALPHRESPDVTQDTLSRDLNHITEESVFVDVDGDSEQASVSLLHVKETTC